jgi:hypothetical protein
MAALNFPPNPTDGQFYPDPPIPGTLLYVWSDAKQAWLTVNLGVQQVRGQSPIAITGTQQTPIVTIPAATQTSGGYMTAADKQRLDTLSTGVTKVSPGTGIKVDPTSGVGDIKISVLPASGAVPGGVYAGTGVTISSTGRLDLNTATRLALGGVKVGQGLNLATDGTISTTGSLVNLKDISDAFNNISTSFTLQRYDGTVYFPPSASNLLIFLGGVLQIPNNAFSAVGSNVIFSAPPPAGATFYGLAIT